MHYDDLGQSEVILFRCQIAKAEAETAPDGLMARCEEMIRIEDREAREKKVDREAREEMIIIDDQNCS
jgi:hypothetical protein